MLVQQHSPQISAATGLPEKKKIPILMYHSISSQASPKFKQFTLSPKIFAEHMAYLHQHHYTPMTVTQFVAEQSRNCVKLPEQPVVLTFDDGFADFYTQALPVLRQYSFVSTLYVATGFIGGTSRWLQHEGEANRAMLTWDQLREISANGIECGGHSHSHAQLDTLSPVEAVREIMQSKRLLEDHLGQPVLSFAYPFGYHTASTRRLVRQAGYTSACAVKNAISSEMTDSFALARLTVRVDTDVEALAALLDGRNSHTLATMFSRALTPVWHLARRSSGLMMRHLHTGLSAR